MSTEMLSTAELNEMGEQLGAYVSSDAAFRPIVIESEFGTQQATLTLGLVLQALATGAGERSPSLAAAVNTARADQSELWSRKLGKELRSAANLWCAFIDDLERGDGGGNWHTEAMRRTRTQRLIEEAEYVGADVAAERARLSACDLRAKRLVGPCPFMLDSALEDAHPRAAYWWLCARPGAG